MYRGYETSQDIDISYGIRWSFIAHFVLIFFIVLRHFFFPATIKPYVPALRVDMVGLPDLTRQELNEIQKGVKAAKIAEKDVPTEAELEKAKNDAMILKKEKLTKARKRKKAREKKKKEKLEKEKKLARKKQKELEKKRKEALDRIRQKQKVKEAIARLKNRTGTDPAVIKGNIISDGASLDPTAREGVKSGYIEIIRDRLRSNWALAPWLARQNLQATVHIFIDSQGRIIRLSFYHSSGNQRFDEEVRLTIKNSDPLPPPPADERNHFLRDGVSVGFPI